MEKRDLSRGLFRQLRLMHGTTCRICGEEGVDYHHIIPLCNGGTNEINNFIPLCHKHHMMVHGCRERAALYGGKAHRGGRPRKMPANYKEILDDYVRCRIGYAECHLLLGMGRTSKVLDKVWYREFLDEKGIKRARNTVDVIAANGVLTYGRKCGFIEYTDGTIENCFWGIGDV